jgi:hypothetical protein
MNILKKGIYFLFAATVIVACSDDDDTPTAPPADNGGGTTTTDTTDTTDTADMSDHPLAATSWSIASEAASLAVGPSKEDLSWWGLSADDVTTRACMLDDVFTFSADGTFSIALGDDTWLETWQADAEGCAAPVAPHVSGDHTWSGDGTTFTLVGEGSFIALQKANNQNQTGTPDANTINYEFSLDENTLMVYVTGFQDDAYWAYKMTKQ